jgi:hypothetical protein
VHGNYYFYLCDSIANFHRFVFRMQMQGMNQYGNHRGFGGPPQPQRQGGRRGNMRGGFRNTRFDQNNQRNQNYNQGQGGQRPNEVLYFPTY